MTPNPFTPENEGQCLCACPKFYFNPTKKQDAFPRVASLLPVKLDDANGYMKSERVPIIKNNPTGVITQNTGINPLGFRLINMSASFGLQLDIPTQRIVTDYMTGNLSGSGLGLAAGDPIPSAVIGRLYMLDEFMPVPIGGYITNLIGTGVQVRYFDSIFDEKDMNNAVITLQRTAATEITIRVEPSNPGDLIPVDFMELIQADFDFNYINGGQNEYLYYVSIMQQPPTSDDEPITINWEIADSGSTFQSGTQGHSVATWKTPQLIYTTTQANDPVVHNWNPKFTFNAVLDNFPNRWGYRSDKPFAILGLCKNLNSGSATPYNPVKDLWLPDYQRTTTGNQMLAFLYSAFKTAASKDIGYEYSPAETLFASFANQNWNAYFENMYQQAESNEGSFVTPGANFTEIMADVSLILSTTYGLDVPGIGAFLQLPNTVWNNCDPNLFTPPGIYGLGDSDTYSEDLAIWYENNDFVYPTLWVVQVIS